MKTSLIEQVDKSRYRLLKWQAIGWTIWYGLFIIQGLIHNKIIFGTLLIIGLIGLIVWTINFIQYLKLMKIINSDSDLKEAMNNELYKTYMYKSFYWGFFTFLTTITIFLVISSFFPIKALLVCQITLYFGILSSFIAALIYNKD
jgi:hypothetical protein